MTKPRIIRTFSAMLLSCASVWAISNQAVAQDAAQAPAPVAVAPTIIKSIQVQGNQRVEANTVAS